MRNTIRVSFLIVFLSVFSQCLFGQVIRKNYREMTDAEKAILMNALRSSNFGPPNTTGTVLFNYRTNHQQLSNPVTTGIHQDNDFLPWHRFFILLFEKALQNTGVVGASKISLPYWDWTSRYYTTSPTDRESTAPLWNNPSFLGWFPSNAWIPTRSFGNPALLPTQDEVNTVLGETNFTQFRTLLEGGANGQLMHNRVHTWVGGDMSQFISPGDPVFFFHHNMIDKIWQDWHNLGRTSSFSEQNMPNSLESGETRFPVAVNPVVTPNEIIDSRAARVKVWFAENGKVILDKYTVVGTENYRYTGLIEAGSRVVTSVNLNGTNVNYLTGNFVVPPSTVCNFLSSGFSIGAIAPLGGYIRLVPGFHAQAGSTFTAKINSSYFNDAAAGARTPEAEQEVADNTLEKTFVPTVEDFVTVYPNPSNSIFNVATLASEGETLEINVRNSKGEIVYNLSTSEPLFYIDLSTSSKGMYLLTCRTLRGKTHLKKLILK